MKNNKSHIKLLVIGLIAMISLLFLTGCSKDLLSMSPDEEINSTEAPEMVDEVNVNLAEYEKIDANLDANTAAYEKIKQAINDKIIAQEGNATLNLSDEIVEIETLADDLSNIEANIKALDANDNISNKKLDAIDYLSQYYDVLVNNLEEFEKGNFKKIDNSLYKTYKVTKEISVAEQNN